LPPLLVALVEKGGSEIVVVKKVFILITPLFLTPVFLFLVSEGVLNFGAGEKDIFLLFPWFFWSVLFLVAGLILWNKSLSIKLWGLKSALYSFAVLAFLWLCLFTYSAVLAS